MLITEIKNHHDLINFYIECGLEFQSLEYVGKPLFSYIIGTMENIIAAVTVTIQNESIVLDDLAVRENYRNKGYGKILLHKAIEHIKSLDNIESVFIITKEAVFFSNFGFISICREDAPDFSICFQCDQYQKNCFPEAMVLYIK